MNIYALWISSFVYITFQKIHAPPVTNALMEPVLLGQIHVVKHLSVWMEPIHLLCVVSQTSNHEQIISG